MTSLISKLPAVFICGPPTAMDIEISRWGEPEDKNAQYVIQPYVVPANTVRFTVPAGTLTHWMDWQPGRVASRQSAARPRMCGRMSSRNTLSRLECPRLAMRESNCGYTSSTTSAIRYSTDLR